MPYTRAYSFTLGMFRFFFMANTFLPLAQHFFSGATFFSGAPFFFWRDFFFLARLFTPGATFLFWRDFLFLARLFFSGATFFLWRDFVDRCQTYCGLKVRKKVVERLVEQDS